MAYGSYFLTLFIFIVATIISLLVYCRGFMLTRIAIHEKASASNHADYSPRYNKSIILIIDALRYDFVQPQHDSSEFYHNKLPHIHDLLSDNSEQSRLYRFVADPPTTTMQRLKGLTTGSLPTFVDAGSNFATAEINEDNIIDQLISSGKNIVFMGDDTWESLFPSRFMRSFPFPSFNVQDLHTVDRGVQKHLTDEISKNDWHILIGHLLGVDHCGHRYGPNHPAMAEKLSEMDELIRSVTEAMDEDTLLIVMGDHGMTRTGDHGGDSPLELDAALFLFSKKTLSVHLPQADVRVSQIDLVPTLSLLLGSSIPYSNLGTVITELFYFGATDQTALKSLNRALYINQRQISNYLRHYSKISNDLPKSDINYLFELERRFNESGQVTEAVNQQYVEYMAFSKSTCQTTWAKFDDVTMIVGLLNALFILILHTILVLELFPINRQSAAIGVVVMTLASLGLCYIRLSPILSAAIAIFLGFLILIFSMKSRNTHVGQVSWLDLFAFILVVLQSLASLSNSLVVNEDKVTMYLLSSMMLVQWLTYSIQQLSLDLPKSKENLLSPLITAIIKQKTTILMVVLYVGVNLSRFFNTCREEQTDCKPSHFLTPLSSLNPDENSYKNLRFFLLSLPCLFSMVRIPSRILQVRGNLNGYGLVSLFGNYGIPTTAFLLSAHWILSAIGTTAISRLPVWQQIFCAQSIYILTLIGIFTCFLWPLAVYMTKEEKTSRYIHDKSMPSLFGYMKQSYANPSNNHLAPPLIYGLATIFSSNYMVLITVLSLLLMMLAGDGMAPSQLLMFACILLYLDLVKCWSSSQKLDNLPLAVVVGYWFLCKHFFYYTGHQPTMPCIRWEAAFQGFAQDHSNYLIPAILLFSSTFASQLVFTIGLPLLIISSETSQLFCESLISSTQRSVVGRGEVVLTQNKAETSKRLFKLVSIFILLNFIKVFFSMFASAMLRRHLMLWKIFAPAFIYEGASYILICLVSCVTFALFTRIVSSGNSFTKDFELDHVD